MAAFLSHLYLLFFVGEKSEVRCGHVRWERVGRAVPNWEMSSAADLELDPELDDESLVARGRVAIQCCPASRIQLLIISLFPHGTA